MVIKIYVSEVSGSNEIRERQQTVLSTLKAKKIEHKIIDVTVDNDEKTFMQQNSISLGATSVNPCPLFPLPPQIFNDQEYCGDYNKFEEANENGELQIFLRL